MFSGIKPAGGFRLGGTAPYNGHVQLAGQNKLSQQSYDQFSCSPRPEGEEARIQNAVSRISQEIRIRPTKHEISRLQQQVQEGTYQPDAREIAARMLMKAEGEA